MEDPERVAEPPQNEAADEAERRRRAAEAMEQMLLAQEGEEEQREQDDGEPQLVEEEQNDPLIPDDHDFMDGNIIGVHKVSFSYIQTSLIAAFALIYYALRTREQWYLALVFLSSSKWAYIVLGNALVASLIWTFRMFIGVFLGGLRLAEAEGIGDFFRWNVTDTCIALTIFRTELNVRTMILFLILILGKCLHWVADLREGHLRMTEEAVVTNPANQWPSIRWHHFKLLVFLLLLQLLDILAVLKCVQVLIANGPNVFILFAFEGAILLVSVVSNILLWNVHLLDGIIHHWHETVEPSRAMHRWIHPWKDHKATLIFAVEVQAQAARFIFYVSFFAIVMTYYAMPINLFREVYVSFQTLRQRLIAFNKYRQLMANMNQFATPTEEELEEEHTCIICRDDMTVENTKRLPGCGHLFHKSCLREWLVQQQSCPTCRGDIFVMQERQRQVDLANERQTEQEAQQAQAAEEQQHEEEEEEEKIEKTEIPVTNPSSDSFQSQGDEKETPGNQTFGPKITEEERNYLIQKRLSRFRTLPKERFSSTTTFHAFYRVIQDEGAIVYDDDLDLVVREVPFGVIILGQEMAWRSFSDERKMMVRIPDGWVCEEMLELVSVLFEDDD